MPPKAKYSNEEILNTAYEIVRKEGADKLTARSLAGALGSSTAPIFTSFKNMDEIFELVIKKAKALYRAYIEKALTLSIPFKECGLKYIQFALDEPRLFKLLFMQGNKSPQTLHYFPADEMAGSVLNAAKSSYNLEDKKARRLYNHLSVYTHGLAVLFAEGYMVFTMEDAGNMLSEMFVSLKAKLDSEEE